MVVKEGEKMGVGKTIRKIMIEEGVGMSELARRLNITRQTLYRRLEGDIKYSNFESIVEALGYEVRIRRKG